MTRFLRDFLAILAFEGPLIVIALIAAGGCNTARKLTDDIALTSTSAPTPASTRIRLNDDADDDATRAAELIRQGRLDEAAALVQHELVAHPPTRFAFEDSVREQLLLRWTEILQLRGNFDQALATMEQVLKTEDGDLRDFVLRGEVFWSQIPLHDTLAQLYDIFYSIIASQSCSQASLELAVLRHETFKAGQSRWFYAVLHHARSSKDEGDRRLLSQLRTASSQLSDRGLGSLREGEEPGPVHLELSSQGMALAALQRKFAGDELPPPHLDLSRGNEVLIDYALFTKYLPQTQSYAERRYLAFAISYQNPEGSPTISVADLGPADVIDGQIKDLRKRIDTQRDITSVSRELYRSLLGPFESRLKQARTVHIWPDGALSAVPFGILAAEHGALLGESKRVLYTSGSFFTKELDGRSGSAIDVYAAPHFDGSCNPRRKAPQPTHYEPLRSTGWPLLFGPLNDTLWTGYAIAKRARAAGWCAHLLVDDQATKKNLLSRPAPRVLHLATHGFFVPPEAMSEEQRVLLLLGFDPLLRSGLALAGANYLYFGKYVPRASDSGLLTAMDILVHDFRSSELVVLEACETGLGEPSREAGVVGLRQAFRIAGARAVMMSLWRVEERATAMLMDEFYSEYFGGTPLADALRIAQNRVRLLLRKEGKDHPYYWAGFVIETGVPQ